MGQRIDGDGCADSQAPSLVRPAGTSARGDTWRSVRPPPFLSKVALFRPASTFRCAGRTGVGGAELTRSDVLCRRERPEQPSSTEEDEPSPSSWHTANGRLA